MPLISDKQFVFPVNESVATTSSVVISVICPVYNEALYIERVLDFFQHSLPTQKELILIDGNSTDETTAIIEAYKTRHNLSNIILLHNEDRYVPYALNKAIPVAKGDIIVRLDAHTEYSPDYFERILETFNQTGADIVGGPMRIAKGSAIQNAIGYATSTKFGVGNSSFHFQDFEGFTDTVYLGAWKKKMFAKTGLFDTTFKRNQDDEFHYRAKSMGFKVYQHPSIKLFYHPRKSLRLLFSQYYQYGLFKPLVLKKVKSAISLRHIIPSLFILYLLSLPLFLLLKIYVALVPLAFYLAAAISLALLSKRRVSELLLIPVVYITIHIAYGLGFLKGLFIKPATLNSPQRNQTQLSL